MESKIRDNLAERLNVIDQSLVLIEKEYFIDPKLKVKTKGFIDILAKDNKDRVVVIEIKRSNQAARQAIHELLKYKVFIRQKFGLKDSEVRLILASSEWSELIYPFSEFASRFQIEGYQLFVNDEWSVQSTKRISKLNIPERYGEFSPNHSVDLFVSKEKRDDFTEMISSKLIKLGIDDFIILDIENENNSRLKYKYCCYIAILKYPIEKYTRIIDLDGRFKEDIKELLDDEITREELLYSLEDCIYSLLDKNIYSDEIEESDPDKLTSMLGVQGWSISNVHAFGIFNSDPRGVDIGRIIYGLKGRDHSTGGVFETVVCPEETDLINEIKDTMVNHEIWPDQFKNTVLSLFEAIIKNIDYNQMNIYIYHPSSLLTSIGHCYNYNDMGYLPLANFFSTDSENRLIIHNISYGWSNIDNLPNDSSELFAVDTMMALFGSLDEILLENSNMSLIMREAILVKDKVIKEADLDIDFGKIKYYECESISLSQVIFENAYLNKLGTQIKEGTIYL